MVQDRDGNCCLHMVVTKPEYAYICYLLIQAEPALLNIRNCEDKTALDYIPVNDRKLVTL